MSAADSARNERSVAIHEAGHAAADLVLGHQVGMISIIPDDHRGTAGRESTLDQDEWSSEGHEAIVISLYAGAEAERRVSPNDPETLAEIAAGAGTDEELAAEHLSFCRRSEAELRREAAELVTEHWTLIEFIAYQLQQFGVLLDSEVYGLYEIHIGEATFEDLARHRLFMQGQLTGLRGRRLPSQFRHQQED